MSPPRNCWRRRWGGGKRWPGRPAYRRRLGVDGGIAGDAPCPRRYGRARHCRKLNSTLGDVRRDGSALAIDHRSGMRLSSLHQGDRSVASLGRRSTKLSRRSNACRATFGSRPIRRASPNPRCDRNEGRSGEMSHASLSRLPSAGSRPACDRSAREMSLYNANASSIH